MNTHEMTAGRRKVLVVDDEVAFTRLLRLGLEGTCGFTVEVVNNPRDALVRAEQFKPDIIVLDVMMPQLDGGDLATRIRANGKLQRVPIVFLTAAVKRAELPPGGGLIGGLRFLAKPLELEEVRLCLAECLGDAEPAAHAVQPGRKNPEPPTPIAHPE
jgi:two-component system, OmpR family, response regulator